MIEHLKVRDNIMEGLREGRLEGLKEGKKEGLKEGLKEGRIEAVKEAARNFYANGVSLDIIAKSLNITKEKVQEYISVN